MLKKWLIKIGAVLGTVALLTGFGPAQAQNELKNVTLSVFMYPIGSPSAFFKDNLIDLYGVDIDLVHELQKRLGFELRENRIFPINFNDGLAKLESGECDLLGGGLSFTEIRAKKYATTPIYLQASLGVVYSTLHNNFKTLKDIRGKRIGTDFTSSSGAYYDYIKKYGGEPVKINNMSLALFLVAQGRLDGILYDRMPLEDFALGVKEARLAMAPTEFGLEFARYTLYMPKQSKYSSIINATMQDMIDDGTVARILRKWRVTVADPEKAEDKLSAL